MPHLQGAVQSGQYYYPRIISTALRRWQQYKDYWKWKTSAQCWCSNNKNLFFSFYRVKSDCCFDEKWFYNFSSNCPVQPSVWLKGILCVLTSLGCNTDRYCYCPILIFDIFSSNVQSFCCSTFVSIKMQNTESIREICLGNNVLWAVINPRGSIIPRRIFVRKFNVMNTLHWDWSD